MANRNAFLDMPSAAVYICFPSLSPFEKRFFERLKMRRRFLSREEFVERILLALFLILALVAIAIRLKLLKFG
jgi:hypothetical protein